LPEIGLKGQESLKKAKILVVGAGGLGSTVLQFLTSAGIGNLGIVDYEIIKENELQRQFLYTMLDLGKHYTIVARQKLLDQNPNLKIDIFNIRIENKLALKIIENYDIIVDCTNNLKTNYFLNDCCIIKKKPLVFASISKYEGKISVFNFKDGPSFRCAFPPINEPSNTDNKSLIYSILPGIFGSLQANEVIKLVIESGNILTGRIFLFNVLKLEYEVIPIHRNPENFNIELLQSYFDQYHS
jgi:adenylyltransferase/sulfurtransferase